MFYFLTMQFEIFEFIQLLNAIERVTNNKQLIGFSCGHQFVITKRTAFTVTIHSFN